MGTFSGPPQAQEIALTQVKRGGVLPGSHVKNHCFLDHHCPQEILDGKQLSFFLSKFLWRETSELAQMLMNLPAMQETRV